MCKLNFLFFKIGRTALYIAVERNNNESVLFLLRNYADTNIRTIKGSAAIICAAGKGHMQCLRCDIKILFAYINNRFDLQKFPNKNI